MKAYISICLFVMFNFFGCLPIVQASETYQVLSYHDIFRNINGASEDSLARARAFNRVEYINENIIGRQDTDAVELSNLINQFAWLKDNGYHAISVQDIVDAEAGKKALPDKSILITFDDGYESFYTYVYPLLKTFNYPAVLALEGSWVNTRYNELVQYGDEKIPRQNFLSREQIKEMSRSGLIEFASHTWNLHKGITGNPQGNLMPAVTTRLYDQKTQSYEQDRAYESRLSADFEKNSAFIESLVGKRPRVMVWPFGIYNGTAQRIAAKVGMPLTMTLNDGVNFISEDPAAIKRYLVSGDPTLSELTRALEKPDMPVMRVMHIDLDYIYDPDPTQQEKNLGLLLERINTAGASAVFIQAFSDDKGSGEASSVYFPNRRIPMKADLFSRVSWQIRTRTTARQVYAWMPLLAFIPQDQKWQIQNSVTSLNDTPSIGYRRLSPFSEEARAYISDIYEDLARYTYFSGILIHDDAVFSDFEDASPQALKTYQKWGLPPSIAQIRADKRLFDQWTIQKTVYLSSFANDLRRGVELFRKPVSLARNYYAEPILSPEASSWFAQSYPDALRNFDWIALMAMPYFEKVESPETWLKQLVDAVKAIPEAKNKTIFELQAKDWNKDQPISNDELMSWMRMLRIEGMQNFGYYPDDPFTKHPDVEIIKREFSTKSLLE